MHARMGWIHRFLWKDRLSLRCDHRPAERLSTIAEIQRSLDQPEALQDTLPLSFDHCAVEREARQTIGSQPHDVIDLSKSLQLFADDFRARFRRDLQLLRGRIMSAQCRTMRRRTADNDEAIC